MTVLSIVNGGAGGGGDRPRRRNWLVEHLWRAVTMQPRADSVAELAQRMSKTTKITISIPQANHVLNVVRANADFYNWSVLHVAKGRDNTKRRFIPVYFSRDGERSSFSSKDRDYVGYGCVSSCKTIASMAKNEGVAMEVYAGVVPPEMRRQIRAIQGALLAVAEMAEKVAAQGLRIVK